MLGDKLLILRKQKKLTQLQLADALEISRQAYNNYENNRREPDYQLIAKFSEYFNVSTDYLLGNTDVPTPMQKKINPSNNDELIKTMLENVPELQKLMNEFVNLPPQEQEEILKYVAYRKSQLLADEK